MNAVPESKNTTNHYRTQSSHWRANLIELSSQALGAYFSSQDPRHLQIYEVIAQLIEGGQDSLEGEHDSE